MKKKKNILQQQSTEKKRWRAQCGQALETMCGEAGSSVLLLFLLSVFVYLETFLNKEPNNHLPKIKFHRRNKPNPFTGRPGKRSDLRDKSVTGVSPPTSSPVAPGSGHPSPAAEVAQSHHPDTRVGSLKTPNIKATRDNLVHSEHH